MNAAAFRSSALKLIRPQTRRVRLLCLAFSGFLTGLLVTFPSGAGALLAWVSLVPAACAALTEADSDKKLRPGRIYLSGFMFFMCEYSVCYHWFWSMYPLEFTGLSRGAALCVVLLGWLGLSALASLAGGLAVLCFVLLCRTRLMRKCAELRPAAAASLYAVFEWFETLGWMGVPWNRLGLSQLTVGGSPALMSSALFGPYFTTFLIVLAAFLIAHSLVRGGRGAAALIALAIFGINLAGGAVCLAAYGSANTPTVTAAAIQGNVPSDEKWGGSQGTTLTELYFSATSAAAEDGADIILWTETAVTSELGKGKADADLRALAADRGLLIAAGTFESDGEGSYANCLRFYLPDGTVSPDSYKKRHLVPFGEYVPYRGFFMNLVPPLADLSVLQNDLVGGDSTSLQEFNGITAGSLICFDSIYEELCRASRSEGADLILLATNDSWFGTSAALDMHLNQARLRAIENGVSVLRAANTGVTALIDRTGAVIARLEPETRDTLLCECPVYPGATLYTRIGNVFVYLCIAFVCGAAAYSSLLAPGGKKKK